jgi:biotin/methionine sulfoxide reductase
MIAMDAAIGPVGESRDDFEILRALARRLGCEETYAEGRDQDGWLRHLYEKARSAAGPLSNAIPDYDGFRKTGWFEIPKRADEYVFLAEFRADPAKNKLATPSGKIDLYSERIAGFGYDDCPPHPTWIAPAEWLGAPLASEYPLHLISSQPRTRLHSQMDCGPVSGAGKIAGREAIAINPADAKLRGITPGDVVRVFNDRGECLAGAEITDGVRAGVVRLSCGAWYDPVDAARADSLCAHGNANVLTRDRGTSKLTQGPTSATTLVEVARWEGPVPPVRAFTPPETVEV